MRFRPVSLCVLLTALLALAGCAGSGPASGLHAPEGRWQIVDHRIGEVSAMRESEAEAWHGRELEFRSGSARLADRHCEQPLYEHRLVEPEAYLAENYRLSTADRQRLRRSDGLLQVTDVICDGRSSTALGGTLLWISEDRAMTPWDGVLFELQRQ